jgi:hypothetical protein
LAHFLRFYIIGTLLGVLTASAHWLDAARPDSWLQ